MDRPWWWSLSLRLRPIQRALAQEVRNALDREFERLETAHRAEVHRLEDANQAVQRHLAQQQRNNAVLAKRAHEAERKVAAAAQREHELRRSNEYLRASNANLRASNANLRASNANLRARLWRRVQVPGTVAVRPRDRSSSSGGECDVFFCLDCRSFLILEAPADGAPTFYPPVDTGCDTCAGLPRSRPPMQSVVESPAIEAVDADLTVPGTRKGRENIAAELVAGFVKNPPLDVAADACAKRVAELARQWANKTAPTHSSDLDAIATGLEKMSDTVRAGVVWCATELLGMPNFLSNMLGYVVADLVTDPLHLKDVSRAVRVVDTIVCTLDGDLGPCASYRRLMIMDLGHEVTADQLKETLDRAIDRCELDEPVAIDLDEPVELFRPEPPPPEIDPPGPPASGSSGEGRSPQRTDIDRHRLHALPVSG